MGKFKVGDRVRVKTGRYEGHTGGSAYNLPRGEGLVEKWTCDSSIVVRYGDRISPPVNGIVAFELVNDGPVRTVTRKEIVPGRYGIVSVGQQFDVPDCTNPQINPQREVVVQVGSVGMVFQTPSYGASELRAAAATFIELADALDEVA